MKITAIKQQERLKGRYSIYVDERYSFSLSADALLDERIVPGQELDAAQLAVYKKLSADDKAYGLALSYVVRRMRSRHELTDYFRRKGYDADLGEQILQKLQKYDLVDDEKFAEAWVRIRRLLKPTSKRKLTQELRAKWVTDSIIARVLQEDEADERTVLAQVITKKRRQSRYQDNVKLMRYLMGQGFNYDDVKNALQNPGEA